MDAIILKTQLAATQASITAYQAAIDALVVGGVQSYTLDTGQNVQTVTKLNLAGLQRTLDSLYNRCATMEARLNGSGTLTARPAW